MSHTWKHEWKFHSKKYWQDYQPKYVRVKKIVYTEGLGYLEPTMAKLLGEEVLIEYCLPVPKIVSSFDPNKYKWYSLDPRTHAVKKQLWQRHRRNWKQALRLGCYDNVLPVRPERYAWILW